MAAARSRGVSWRVEVCGWRDLLLPQREALRRVIGSLGVELDAAGQARIFDRALADRCLERLKHLRQPCVLTLLIHGFGELRPSGTPRSAA